jgi:hypothetical protein
MVAGQRHGRNLSSMKRMDVEVGVCSVIEGALR